jgi:aryl-alcohol dehydrogenase-like predicted oxidoreductase
MTLTTERRERAGAERRGQEGVALGTSGVRISPLGMGTGSNGWNGASNQTRLGQAEFTRVVRHAFERGVTFFDTADAYGSHTYLREALRGLPRDRIQIQTKIVHRTAAEAEADLERFHQEIGTDYLDSVLIHVVTEPDWNRRYRGVMDVLSEAKARGIVGACGCTCHSLPALETAAAEPWVEINQARYNPRGVSMDAAPEAVRPVLERMRRAGKGVLAMKVLGNAQLAAEKAICIRACLATGVFHGLVIGFERPAEVDEVLALMEAS